MKVVRISATWCMSCLFMRPRWDKVFSSEDFEIIDYDYDLNHEQVVKYEVGKTIPVLIFLDDNNNEIRRIVGEKKEKELEIIIGEIKNEKNII
jgi:thiol-disulfide isomerase/thioredoxin